ncbi:MULTISPECIES: TetR/AcrR family transcriptional regulator [unclassified Polaromonas]|uniref:TetR/AcrR family transcriptional regulator n=1 Tax=unclassified Polaromonas TaxID=2638319 RepID=UPI000F0853E3|nr:MULTISPECIES: TetR/AcrR family transcriptional regulator [unclassified Polaromonas]AYQ26685.1 TetR/AcrR family transcriptional regulator [Polaromonas sp. SP1]QGJ18470.1 TetR family transcriptional regulator [Polaromonas sp. Pch-P]
MSLSKLFCDKTSGVAAKRERRKEARPGELLDAALDLFVEKGFAATRAEEVAARAGVSKGTLFLYFQSKEELFKAVVRENISGRFTEWRAELDVFEGSTPELLAYCMHSWWERVGLTRASGLTKLMMSEAKNFPDIAAFYQQEVIMPGHGLIRDILQRGVDRGEFGPMDLDYAVYLVVAPMIFLILSRHTAGICISSDTTLDPKKYIDFQVQTILGGISAPAATAPATRKAAA